MAQYSVFEISTSLAGGCLVGLSFALVASFFGLILAIFYTLIRFYKVLILSFFVELIISIFRGTPLLVQVVFFYYSFPSIGFLIPASIAALIAFILNSSAYTAETLRGALEGLDVGQMEACKTLGIPSWLMWKDILFPQILRLCIPSLGGEFTTLLKDTSVLSIIGVSDIMQRAYALGSMSYDFSRPLLVAAVFYYIGCSISSFIFSYIEKRLKHYDKSN